jgi:hypothetical protein
MIKQAMIKQDVIKQGLVKQDLAEEGFRQPRPDRGTAPACIACAIRGQIPCSMRRGTTRADMSTSEPSVIAGVPRRGPVAIIDDRIIEQAWAG